MTRLVVVPECDHVDAYGSALIFTNTPGVAECVVCDERVVVQPRVVEADDRAYAELDE